MFDGPPPMVMACTDADHECRVVGNWISERLREGCAPNEVGDFVRSDAELERARSAVKSAGARAVELNDKVEVEDGAVAISTMHFAKGLEFRSVVVMACDDDVIPQSARIESVADDADFEEVYNTERHLLYVACTRARNHLLVTGITPVALGATGSHGESSLGSKKGDLHCRSEVFGSSILIVSRPEQDYRGISGCLVARGIRSQISICKAGAVDLPLKHRRIAPGGSPFRARSLFPLGVSRFGRWHSPARASARPK